MRKEKNNNKDSKKVRNTVRSMTNLNNRQTKRETVSKSTSTGPKLIPAQSMKPKSKSSSVHSGKPKGKNIRSSADRKLKEISAEEHHLRTYVKDTKMDTCG